MTIGTHKKRAGVLKWTVVKDLDVQNQIVEEETKDNSSQQENVVVENGEDSGHSSRSSVSRSNSQSSSNINDNFVNDYTNNNLPFLWEDVVNVFFSDGSNKKGTINYINDDEQIIEIDFKDSWCRISKNELGMLTTELYQNKNGVNLKKEVIEVTVIEETQNENIINKLNLYVGGFMIIVTKNGKEQVCDILDIQDGIIYYSYEQKTDITTEEVTEEINVKHGFSFLGEIVAIYDNWENRIQAEEEEIKTKKNTEHIVQEYQLTSEETYQILFDSIRKKKGNLTDKNMNHISKMCTHLNSLLQEKENILSSVSKTTLQDMMDKNEWNLPYFIPVMKYKRLKTMEDEYEMVGLNQNEEDNVNNPEEPIVCSVPDFIQTIDYTNIRNSSLDYFSYVNNIQNLIQIENPKSITDGIPMTINNSFHLINYYDLKISLSEKDDIKLFRSLSKKSLNEDLKDMSYMMGGICSVPGLSKFGQSDINTNKKSLCLSYVDAKRNVLSYSEMEKKHGVFHFLIVYLGVVDGEQLLQINRIKNGNETVSTITLTLNEFEEGLHYPFQNLNVDTTAKLNVCLPEAQKKINVLLKNRQGENSVNVQTLQNKSELTIENTTSIDGDMVLINENNREEQITLETYITDAHVPCDFEFEKYFIYYEFDVSFYKDEISRIILNKVVNHILNVNSKRLINRYLTLISSSDVTNYNELEQLLEKYNVDVSNVSYEEAGLFNLLLQNKIQKIMKEDREKIMETLKSVNRHVEKLVTIRLENGNNKLNISIPILEKFEKHLIFKYHIQQWINNFPQDRSFISKTAVMNYLEQVRGSDLTFVINFVKSFTPDNQVSTAVQRTLYNNIIMRKNKNQLINVNDVIDNVKLQQRKYAVQRLNNEHKDAMETLQHLKTMREHTHKKGENTLSQKMEKETNQLFTNNRVLEHYNAWKASTNTITAHQKMNKGWLLWNKLISEKKPNFKKMLKLLNTSKLVRNPKKDEKNTWYYDPNFNIPIICKHWDLMIQYKIETDEKKSEGLKKKLIGKFGVRDYGEDYVTCLNCGEPLINIEYENMEFSKDGTLKNAFDVLIDDKTILNEIEKLETGDDNILNKHVWTFVKNFFSLLSVAEFTDEDYLKFTKELIWYIYGSKRLETMRKLFVSIQKSHKPSIPITKNQKTQLDGLYEYKWLMSKAVASKKGDIFELSSEHVNNALVSTMVVVMSTYLFIQLQTNEIELSVSMSRQTEISYTMSGFPLTVEEDKVKGIQFLRSFVSLFGQVLNDHPFYKYFSLEMMRKEDVVNIIKLYWLNKEDIQSKLISKRSLLEKESHVKPLKNSINLPLTKRNRLWVENDTFINNEPEGLPQNKKKIYSSQKESLSIFNVNSIIDYNYWNTLTNKKLLKENGAKEMENRHNILFYKDTVIRNLDYHVFQKSKNNKTMFNLLPLFYCFNEPYVGYPRIFGRDRNICFLSGERSDSFNTLMVGKKEEIEKERIERLTRWEHDPLNPHFNEKEYLDLLLKIEQNNVVDVNLENHESNLLPVHLEKIKGLIEDEEWSDMYNKYVELLELDSNRFNGGFQKMSREMERFYTGHMNEEIKVINHISKFSSVSPFEKTLKFIKLLVNLLLTTINKTLNSSSVTTMNRASDNWGISDTHIEFMSKKIEERMEKSNVLDRVDDNNEVTQTDVDNTIRWFVALKEILQNLSLSEVPRERRNVFYVNLQRYLLYYISYKMLFGYQGNQLSKIMKIAYQMATDIMVWEDETYMHFYNIKYILEAREKAKEEEKQQHLAIFESVSEEMREVYRDHQKFALGKFSAGAVDQSKYSF